MLTPIGVQDINRLFSFPFSIKDLQMISRIVALLVVGLMSVSVGCSPAMPWGKPKATAQFYFVEAGNTGKPMAFKGVIIVSKETVEVGKARLQIVRPIDCQDGPLFKATVTEQLQLLEEHFDIESVTIENRDVSLAIVEMVKDTIFNIHRNVGTSENGGMLSETYFQELTKWETPNTDAEISEFKPETLLPDAS